MFLSVHTCAGAVIGRFSPNPVVAFLLGIISHFILDMIPHGDLKIYEDYVNRKIMRRALAIALLDGIFAIYTAMFILVGYNRFGNEINIAAGMAGAMLPDILEVFYELTKTRFLKWSRIVHLKVHRLIAKKKEVAYFVGIVYQLVLLSCLLVYTQTF
ncbi:MAG: hypothetical protein HQ536_04300 [Parcubacteria group bacterium]|nr:hypothetical protein [Parcubacteria group bacterium]